MRFGGDGILHKLFSAGNHGRQPDGAAGIGGLDSDVHCRVRFTENALTPIGHCDTFHFALNRAEIPRDLYLGILSAETPLPECLKIPKP